MAPIAWQDQPRGCATLTYAARVGYAREACTYKKKTHHAAILDGNILLATMQVLDNRL
jgi:hypothetical protein